MVKPGSNHSPKHDIPVQYTWYTLHSPLLATASPHWKTISSYCQYWPLLAVDPPTLLLHKWGRRGPGQWRATLCSRECCCVWEWTGWLETRDADKPCPETQLSSLVKLIILCNYYLLLHFGWCGASSCYSHSPVDIITERDNFSMSVNNYHSCRILKTVMNIWIDNIIYT